MNKYVLLISTLVLISCKSEGNADSSATKAQDTTAFRKSLQIEDPGYTLEPDARKFALNWVEFITAQNEVRKLEQSSLKEVMSNSGAIAQIMESLKNSVPDSLRSTAVEARLNVVNTKAQLLKQYSGKQDPRAEDIDRTSRELHQEFNNLKLQMNEIFLKSLEDFEKELDEFEKNERRRDTLIDSL